MNKNAIPFDTDLDFKPGGIRVGTPAVTTRGMKEEEMLEIADLLAEALANAPTKPPSNRVREKVRPADDPTDFRCRAKHSAKQLLRAVGGVCI